MNKNKSTYRGPPPPPLTAVLLFLANTKLHVTNNIIVIEHVLLGVVKKNPLFLHEIEWKNNEFLFTTPNILHYSYNLI